MFLRLRLLTARLSQLGQTRMFSPRRKPWISNGADGFIWTSLGEFQLLMRCWSTKMPAAATRDQCSSIVFWVKDTQRNMRSIGQMCGRQYLLAETLIIGWLTEMVCGNICRPRGKQTFLMINLLKSCLLQLEKMLRGKERLHLTGLQISLVENLQMAACRQRRKPHRSSWGCKCNVLNAITIHLIVE